MKANTRHLGSAPSAPAIYLPMHLATLALAVSLAACSGPRKNAGDNEPTLASLATREVPVAPATLVATSEERTIAAYRRFLQAAPGAPQRPEAMRRLGDLEMDGADRRATDDPAPADNGPASSASTSNGPASNGPASNAPASNGPPDSGPDSGPDYRAAIERYQEFLKAYPGRAGNDGVLYQLARAQEQGGALEVALKTLTRLVQEHPDTAFHDEAQFRRGELLFSLRDYAGAERAYATVLRSTQPTPVQEPLAPDERARFRERALYMQGWSLFKQGRLEDALHPFFGVLDLKLGGLGAAAREEDRLEALPGLTRADRELVEDSFRVVSISLSNLQGAESVAAYMPSELRRGYEFRVYQQLAELYIRQDRIKDAADTLALFVRRQPLHALSPVLLSRVIDIYQNAGFDTLALAAKKDYVARYGIDSDFSRASPAGWERAQPLVKTHLAELARHHHTRAQTSLRSAGRDSATHSADVQEAVHWYRVWLASFPTDAQTPQSHFLLAELLFENGQPAQAATEYTQVAYGYPRHARSADAGYAALLGLAEQEQRASAAQRPALQRAGVDSALRFAQTFTGDVRAGTVLVNAAEKLFALGAGEGERAADIARQALALQPAPAQAQRAVAWTVLAHSAFERGAFADAEHAYGEVLALAAPQAPERGALVERLAASIYKQGEQARAAGQPRQAVGYFERVAGLAALAPQSAVRATAQFDAAAVLLGLKDWDAAARALEEFRRHHAGHALQAGVSGQLALAYFEQGQWAAAAAEFERLAATSLEPEVARSALWQAAELHEKAGAGVPPKPAVDGVGRVAGGVVSSTAAKGARAKEGTRVKVQALPNPQPTSTATQAWERYLQKYPQPLPAAIEARWRLASLARKEGQPARALAWMKQLLEAERAGAGARTERTRTLGGLAALALAEPVFEAYAQVALVEPLQKQLKLKRARMQEVLNAYTAAAADGMPEVTTAATFRSAALYQDFGRALIGSQRPKKLSKAELEQYNVLLEEQAYPFEEKAIELHEANARRTVAGLYDEWVRLSFTELARLLPVRYGKTERAQGVIDSSAAIPAAAQSAFDGALRALRAGRLDEAVAALEAAVRASPRQPLYFNQLGIAYRERGQFAQARQAYESAIELDARYAAPQLNLAILLDLYLGDAPRAQALYQRCLELAPAEAPLLNKWLAEIKARKPAPALALAAGKEKE